MKTYGAEKFHNENIIAAVFCTKPFHTGNANAILEVFVDSTFIHELGMASIKFLQFNGDLLASLSVDSKIDIPK